MQSIRRVLVAFFEDSAPRGTIIRARIRILVDALTALFVTLLAVILIVGYQTRRYLPLGDRAGRT